MANDETAILNLARAIQQKNPQLYDAIALISENLFRLDRQLNPPVGLATGEITGTSTALADIVSFTAETFPTNLRLSWNLVANAFQYEIRLGSTWDTASLVLVTSSNVANLNPIDLNLVVGTYNFLIKSKTIDNLYSANAASTVVTVADIAAPDFTLQGFANSALLFWTAPASTWAIAYYIIRRNGVDIGHLNGTFKLLQENAEGDYTYSVQAVDIVGNLGAISPELTVHLTAPTDFVFIDEIFDDLGGTYTQTHRIEDYAGLDGIIGAVADETWSQHFSNNSFANIQDQIDAGYPLYYQPTASPGTYVNVYDFGTTHNNTTITATWTKIPIFGTVNISVEFEASLDNVTYGAPQAGPSVFFATFRYIRATYTFTNTADTDAAFIYNIRAVLNTQLVTDSGIVAANSGDAGGTQITFNITFSSINSLTLGVESANPRTVVYQNLTGTGAKVLVFNAAGTRVSENVSWQAKGLI